MGVFGNGYIIERITDPYADESFTPEYIRSVRESLMNINIDNVNITIVNESGSSKKGLKNSSEIKSKLNSTSKEIANDITKNGLNKKSISSIMDKFWKTCVFELDASTLEDVMEKDKSFTKAKIEKALKLLLCVCIVNATCDLVLTILFKGIGSYLTGVLVAPIVEENAKQIAIKDGITKEFTVVFNAFEYTEYLFKYGPKSGFANVAKLRVFPVAMHIIHKELGIEDLEKDEKKKRISFIGHLIGVLIHAAWNAGGSMLIIPKSLW